jgi:hypothetical protein
MATFAQGARTGLAYVVESNFGTTPVTPTLISIPYVSHSLNLTKDRVQGQEIIPDRMPRHDRHGNRQAGGDIVVQLGKGDFDPFLESAFFNTWSTNTLKIGTAPKYFTIEEQSLDITQFRKFTGMAVGFMAVSIAPNQMVNTTFSFVGKDSTIAATSVSASAPTAASTNPPFDAYSGGIRIANTGGSLGATNVVTSLDFTLNNALAPTFVIGSSETPALEFGRAEIEGTMNVYFEDTAFINRFLNETETALEVITEAPNGDKMTWLFPRVKINSFEVGVEGATSRQASVSFAALFDTVEGSSVTLTRSA